jgi:hypothetical protein
VKILAVLFFILPWAGFGGSTQNSPANWTGKYAPCNRHADLLNTDHVNLAVRFSTANVLLAQQFERAMDFWAGVLDIEWHQVDSEDCAIQLVDGTPSLFDFCACVSARSQFPDREDFQGWIAFNPRFRLTKHEMFLDSVHEIGHLLGLAHNPSSSSVMFYFGLDKSPLLDTVDLDALALRHRLRAQTASTKDVRVVEPRPAGTLSAVVRRHFSRFSLAE